MSEDSEYANFMRRSKELYEDALASLPNPDPPREFQGIFVLDSLGDTILFKTCLVVDWIRLHLLPLF